jgi:hypothetical protein
MPAKMMFPRWRDYTSKRSMKRTVADVPPSAREYFAAISLLEALIMSPQLVPDLRIEPFPRFRVQLEICESSGGGAIPHLHFSIRSPRPIVLEVMDGYFTDDSAIRRIGRESVLMLGGARALLMQAAHPLVAAGIVDHSRYREDPWRRLARTMAALYTIVFGTRAS